MSEQPMGAEIVWDDSLRFTATAGGHQTRMDGDGDAGSTPMELLMEALAACMAVDIVYILGRRRSELESLRARIKGARADSYPRRFTAFSLHFEIAGARIDPADVARAIHLSRKKYCSVYATLRPDTDVDITYEIV
jgi:putative redox protein